MSFLNDLKDELLEIKLPPCCRKAFLSGVIRGTGTLVLESGSWNLHLENPSLNLIERCIEHINSIIKLQPEVYKKERSGGLGARTLYGVVLSATDGSKLLSALNVSSPASLMECADLDALKNQCCLISYIRGLFLSSGSMVMEDRDEANAIKSKGYSLDINLSEEYLAERILAILQEAGLEPKLRVRKNACAVYFRGAEALSDFLAYIGASKMFFVLQEVLVRRSLNNTINRQSNCENANQDRAMNAANKQHDAVTLINNTVGISSLDESLKFLAEARLNNPLTPLQDLAEFIPNPPGKSGIRHRMDKIMEIAAGIEAGNTTKKKQ